jgi:lysophospholipase L1-like esterase
LGVNSRGYRAPEFSVPKPKGVVRVVVLGGSAAFDIYAPAGADWPRQVEALVRQRGYPSVEIINAGVPGHATWDVLGRLYSEVWLLEPDLVVIYEAWNDIKYFGLVSQTESLLRTQRPLPVTRGSTRVANPFLYPEGWLDGVLSHSEVYTRLRTRYLVWRFRERGLEGMSPRRLEESYGPWGPRQYGLTLRLIVDAAREVGAEPVLLTQARLPASDSASSDRQRIRYEWVGLTHDALVRAFADCDRLTAETARDKHCLFLDAGKALAGRSDCFSDHVHLTAAGGRVLAERVADFLVAQAPPSVGVRASSGTVAPQSNSLADVAQLPPRIGLFRGYRAP